mgnify:CR=1 FL=1
MGYTEFKFVNKRYFNPYLVSWIIDEYHVKVKLEDKFIKKMSDKNLLMISINASNKKYYWCDLKFNGKTFIKNKPIYEYMAFSERGYPLFKYKVLI